MKNKKTLYDVINNQESIINTIKTLEKHVTDIRTRQITLEAVKKQMSLMLLLSVN